MTRCDYGRVLWAAPSIIFVFSLVVCIVSEPSFGQFPNFNQNSIMSMSVRPIGQAGCAPILELTITHLPFCVPLAFPCGKVEFPIVDPGTTTGHGSAGSLNTNCYSSGTITFTFVPPLGGPFEIRPRVIGFAPPLDFLQ